VLKAKEGGAAVDTESILREIQYVRSRLDTLERTLAGESTPETMLELYKRGATKIGIVDVLE
jgi:hypothetical protein